MTVLCLMRGHTAAPESIGWIGDDEVGRCCRCSRDLRKEGPDWRPLPPGVMLVRSRASRREPWEREAAAGAIGSLPRVDLHDVALIGEKTYGSHQYALVVLNSRKGAWPSHEAARGVFGIDSSRNGASDRFDWEEAYVNTPPQA